MNRKDLARDIWRAADIMRRDDGTNGINEYIEQISWMFFLKIFEDLENRFEMEQSLVGKKYERIIPHEYTWSTWTQKSWKKEEIITFIDRELFPYLASLKGSLERETIGLIFSEVKSNKMKSAFNLKDVISILDEIDFNNPEDSHILSQFYEDLLVKLGKESGIAGEFYTPRAVVKFLVKVIDPELDPEHEKRILDPFSGSCGFLIESFNYLIHKKKLSAKAYNALQRTTLHGYEKKSLPYLVGIMNCKLHGLLTPLVVRKNSLGDNIMNFGSDDKFDYVLTNPPFGGTENKLIQQNFPIRIQATELLALQYVMRRLKHNGRCGIVVPEGLLSRGDAFQKVRKELLENFNVHTIVSLPAGVFANVTPSGQGPKTNLLFFDRTTKTKDIWFYDLIPHGGKKYSKTKLILDNDFNDCFEKWKHRTISSNSWIVDADDIIKNNYDMRARNPNQQKESSYGDPVHVINQISDVENDIRRDLDELRKIMMEQAEK